MADASDLTFRALMQGTYGNVVCERLPLTLANGDANPSTHRFVKLPTGLMLLDAFVHITTASNASVTANIGIKSLVGTNQDNATYFFSAQALSSTAFVRKTVNNVPIITAQDMYVQLVVGGAAVTQATALELYVFYKNVGNL